MRSSRRTVHDERLAVHERSRRLDRVPDRRGPDAASAQGTGSAVFRLVTHRRDFGNVAVSFSLRNDEVVSTMSTPPVAWDGVHVFLRYQNPDRLYSASANRRDGPS